MPLTMEEFEAARMVIVMDLATTPIDNVYYPGAVVEEIGQAQVVVGKDREIVAYMPKAALCLYYMLGPVTLLVKRGLPDSRSLETLQRVLDTFGTVYEQTRNYFPRELEALEEPWGAVVEALQGAVEEKGGG